MVALVKAKYLSYKSTIHFRSECSANIFNGQAYAINISVNMFTGMKWGLVPQRYKKKRAVKTVHL